MVLQRDLERGNYSTPVTAYLLRLRVHALINTWAEKKASATWDAEDLQPVRFKLCRLSLFLKKSDLLMI